MDRRKAIALAGAVAMSLTSGVIALGANFGALGFGSAPRVAAATEVSVPTTSGAQSKTAPVFQEREHDDAARTTQSRANSADTTRGEHNG